MPCPPFSRALLTVALLAATAVQAEEIHELEPLPATELQASFVTATGGGIVVQGATLTSGVATAAPGTAALGVNYGLSLAAAASLNASATLVATQALLRSITYENVSDAPSTLARSVTVVLSETDDGRTVMDFTHAGLKSEQSLTGHRQGWTSTADRLEACPR